MFKGVKDFVEGGKSNFIWAKLLKSISNINIYTPLLLFFQNFGPGGGAGGGGEPWPQSQKWLHSCVSCTLDGEKGDSILEHLQ